MKSCAVLLFVSTMANGLEQYTPDLGLEQYTPDLADWTTLNEKAVLDSQNTDHTPDGIHWLSETDWLPWDGTVYNASEYSRSDLQEWICPGNTIRGLRDVFYEHNPFADPVNPTKAEVDNWHRIAVNHVRAMVGYTEEEYQIQPDKCLHIRALWSDERKNTRMWDDDYPGGCEGTTNPHCGAGFIPSVEDQQPYLPDDIDSCGSTAGSEGIFNSAKSNIPWSIKWARPFCYTLGAEGFWGGHTGPWFHRPKFGWSWWDGDPDNSNSNANLRTKWSGSLAPNKYEDPRVTNGDNLVLVEDVDPNSRFSSFQCLQGQWMNGAQTATDCYYLTMDNPECGKRFMTYVNGGGCACYPVDMDTCDPRNAANRGTWDFDPRESSFDGLMIDAENPLWSGRRCFNIQWKSTAGDATQCLQQLMEAQHPDCARNFMTWNSANGGCACYPPEQTSCERSETVGESGRKTFVLIEDPAYEPPTTTPPTISPPPTLTPTDAPTDVPTNSPTDFPTDVPIDVPTDVPTNSPTDFPTDVPIDVPTDAPTDVPTYAPTNAPTDAPTESPAPIACEDSELSISYRGNLFSCEVVPANACNNPKVKTLLSSHCPNTCDSCEEYACEDSSANWRFNNREFRCNRLANLDPDRIAEICGLYDEISTTCRGTCGYCN